jgi:hypothetical protein
MFKTVFNVTRECPRLGFKTAYGGVLLMAPKTNALQSVAIRTTAFESSGIDASGYSTWTNKPKFSNQDGIQPVLIKA